MIIITAFLVGIALLWAWSFYSRKALQYLKNSNAIWDRLYAASKAVVEDPMMPREAVGFAVASVMCAGCGCLAGQILRDHFLRNSRKRSGGSANAPPLWREMTESQRLLFSKVVTTAIFYDCLRAPVLGLLVRRVVFPWLSSVVNGDAKPPVTHGVQEIVTSSRRAIASRPEGKRALALHV